MANRLFGYTVEEEDGKLLISIEGLLGENCIRQIRESAQGGREDSVLSQLFLQVSSLCQLMAGGGKPQEKALQEEAPQEEALTLEQLLGQNVDQSFAAFEEQLSELRETIKALKTEESS